MPPTSAPLLAEYGSPLYVYDLETVRERADALRAAFTYRPLRLLYAIKANPCPPVARTLIAAGYGIDAVSPGEVALGLKLGLDPADILYTENNMTDLEMAQAMDQGVLINCGSLDRLERLGVTGAREAAVRFNPDVGDSEHAKTLTAGPLTKFGVHHSQVNQVRSIEERTGIRVVGAHMHIGSGSLDAQAFIAAMEVILATAIQLPNLRFIDFGGGIGVPYRPDQQAIDLAELGATADRMMRAFCRQYGRELELRLEPGRFLVAEAGTLYTTVTSVKTNPATTAAAARTYVGTDTGFNHLVRPCMYGSYHPITNITNPDGPRQRVDVVGNICESGDVFARDRELAEPRVGDVLAIGCAGAYGMSMASTYNLRDLPAEVVVDGVEVRLARKRTPAAELIDAWEW
ncbi:MAG: diaminopimelate decarboxylase [Guyparkeria sp.]